MQNNKSNVQRRDSERIVQIKSRQMIGSRTNKRYISDDAMIQNLFWLIIKCYKFDIKDIDTRDIDR